MEISLQGRKIMVAVGDDSLGVSLGSILELEGATSSRCADVVELQRRIDDPATDLWIVDCELPGIPHKGLDAIVSRCRVPVLLISADPLQRSNEATDPNPVLGVPFRRQELICALLSMLGDRSQGSPSAPAD